MDAPAGLTFVVTGPNGYEKAVTYGEFSPATGTYTISGLEPGTYTVTEESASAYAPGYELSVLVNGESGSSAEVSVEIRTANTVAFDNHYERIPGNDDPTIIRPNPVDPVDPPAPVEPGIPDVPPYIPPHVPSVEDDEPIEIDEPEVPLGEVPGEDLEELPDDEVPLADVPKTGDPLMALLAVLGASGAGVTGLALRGKREEEDED